MTAGRCRQQQPLRQVRHMDTA
eukprot:SAG25_NODE_6809_length_528_cov_0.811189_1_plen_21_part_10